MREKWLNPVVGRAVGSRTTSGRLFRLFRLFPAVERLPVSSNHVGRSRVTYLGSFSARPRGKDETIQGPPRPWGTGMDHAEGCTRPCRARVRSPDGPVPSRRKGRAVGRSPRLIPPSLMSDGAISASAHFHGHDDLSRGKVGCLWGVAFGIFTRREAETHALTHARPSPRGNNAVDRSAHGCLPAPPPLWA